MASTDHPVVRWSPPVPQASTRYDTAAGIPKSQAKAQARRSTAKMRSRAGALAFTAVTLAGSASISLLLAAAAHAHTVRDEFRPSLLQHRLDRHEGRSLRVR